MRSALIVMILAVSAFGQQASGARAAACGPKSTSFTVKLDESQHTLAQLEPGKALVYFVQDIGEVNCFGSCLTTKMGLDGAWVGANQRNSYFSLSVVPGEHHVCANPQSHVGWISRRVALAHFTAEAGKVYYFRTRGFMAENQIFFDLDPIDSDQAMYFISSYPLSVSHAKP
ncbi:MAG TPA: DUF2846 domain-containing protein [Candidatus Sulfotelmatobacter sp.]|nr:DUF2846 domain-containing protein [Candidatus Sulfotelmatobacter sp.]